MSIIDNIKVHQDWGPDGYKFEVVEEKLDIADMAWDHIEAGGQTVFLGPRIPAFQSGGVVSGRWQGSAPNPPAKPRSHPDQNHNPGYPWIGWKGLNRNQDGEETYVCDRYGADLIQSDFTVEVGDAEDV
jgi:hypothetical protein